MKKLLVSAFALTSALVAVSAPASAAIVDFEDKTAFSCNGSGSDSSGGLSYSYGFYVCYYSPTNPADFPTAPASTVMASGYYPTTFSALGGGTFSLQSVDLGFGPFQHGGLTADTTTVTGNLFGGGTVSTTLNVTQAFSTHALNWSNLVSVSFGALNTSSEYLAFDNIVYNTGVPEPAAWAMMLAGFGLVGSAMRRRSKVAVSFA